jgi:hypothetical protein
MRSNPPFLIAACVSEEERRAVQSASEHIIQTLGEASGLDWICEARFCSDLASLQQVEDAAVYVTSFLPELKSITHPWSETEQRLKSQLDALCKSGKPVFICTILRHVDRNELAGGAALLLIHIRRLNLLAAEISREHGACVVDLDRVLADVGARRLQTDYRLAGNSVAEMAGHFTAQTLIENAPEEIIPFETQDAAKVLLASRRPRVGDANGIRPELTLRKGLMTMGQGRRKQVVAPVAHTVEDSYAGWLVRQVLRGAVSPGEALQRLFQAVRRRGVRESAALLATGLSRQVERKR